MAVQVAPTGTVNNVSWATGFLTAIGAPVTQNNINNVIAWGTAESGNVTNHQTAGGWNNYNPLNVVHQPGIPDIGMGGQQGNIANFGNEIQGTAASAHLFLNNPNAAGIIQTLRQDGSRSQLNSAVNQFYGSWGGSLSLSGVDTSPGTASATLTSFPGSGIIKDLVPGGGGLVAGLDFLAHPIYFAEVIGGFLLLVLGVIIVLVDTGALSKAPVPIPIPV